MKYKALLVSALLFNLLTNAQIINDEKIMGKWETVNFEIANSDEIPQKDAIKLLNDAFLGSKFNFKGNRVFKIEFAKSSDDRIKELSFLDNQNWVISNNQINIGTESDGFSSMHIIVQESNDKVFFILPMIRLEMIKLNDDKPSKPKFIKSKTKESENIDYSNVELISEKIDESQIVEFNLLKNPPLAPDCKSRWKLKKRQECTNKFIQRHLMVKFDTDLASDVGISGKINIKIAFIIDTNGQVINVTAIGGPDIMNQNAIEVMGMLPQFKPAIKDGKPINVSYKMPLLFQVVD